MCDLVHAIDRLAEIKTAVAALNTEKAELEAELLKQAAEDLSDTKLKSVTYTGLTAKAVSVVADSVKVVYPSLLHKIFGTVYKDVVTEKYDVKLSAPAGRLIAGLWLGNYNRIGMAEVIAQLPCDGRQKELLAKKLKGVNYETDKKNLMAIGGFDDKAASDYAYFVAESAVWDNLLQLMQAQNKAGLLPEAGEIDRLLQLINAAVVVEQTPKVSVEAL
ncbi:MAG: hypothetical protein ACK5L0_04750 [Candidatus Fimivivens sp.]